MIRRECVPGSADNCFCTQRIVRQAAAPKARDETDRALTDNFGTLLRSDCKDEYRSVHAGELERVQS